MDWEPLTENEIVQDPPIQEIKEKMGDKAEDVLSRMKLKEVDIYDLVGDYIVGEEEGMGSALDRDGYCQENCNWYEHEKDMKKMSLYFRNVLFTLHGDGEESGDIWNKYFLNGRMETADAVVSIAPVSDAFLKGEE